MAVFERQAKVKPGTRSNTKLVISGGFSPAEHWITDPTLPVLFNYEYGGAGQKEVVISKGMAVGIMPEPQLDYETGKKKGAVTIAGANGANNVIGIAPYNITKHNNDFLDGNQPSIITKEYIELPYIPNAADAAEVKWGAVHGAGLKNGDLVTYSRDPQNLGKLVKWEEGNHSFADILGQVLAQELDQEPWGWLKWALWDEAAKKEDLGPEKAGYAAPGVEGFPFDANYAEGTIDQDGYLGPYTTNPTGIPGILDGSAKAQTPQVKETTVPAGYAGTPFTVDLGLKNIVEGTVKVTVDGQEVGGNAVDLKNGLVTIASATAGQSVRIDFRAHFFGTPAGWDYKGAVGAVRILLKR